MPKLIVKEGTTSKLTHIFIQDSSSTVGAGLTGLVYNSSGLSCYYKAEGDASATSISLATQTQGTWASAGFVVVSDANMPGIYEIGIPNVVIDNTSEGSTIMYFKGATNMAPCILEIQLESKLASDVSTELTSVDSHLATVSGNIDSHDSHLSTVSGNVDSILTDTADLQTNQGNWLTATGFATSVELAVVSGNVDSIFTDTTYLQANVDSILTDTADLQANQGNWLTATGFSTSVELAVVSGNVDSILTDTADLQANQGNWLTATGFSTSAELTSIDSHLAVVSGNVDSILTDTADLQANQGNWTTATGFATSVELAVVSGNVDSILTDTADLQANQGNWLTATGFSTSVELAVVSGNVDSILTDTAELQTDWVDGGRLDTILDTAASAAADDAATIYTYFVSGSNEDAFKADVSALATSVELAVVSGNVDSILTDTADLQANQGNWLTATGFSTSVELAVVSGNVDSILTDTADLQANQGNWLTATGFSTSAELTSIDSHLAVVSGNVDSILTDTADLQANQGNWTTATGFATSVELAVVSGNVDSILTDTADLQANQGNWLTATGFSTSVELAVVSGNVDSILTDTAELQTDWVDGGRLDTILDTAASAAADDAATIYTYFVSGSNEDAFKADVSALATSVELAVVSGNVDSILTDTADLQANQGNWLTATGFSTSAELTSIDSHLAVVSGNVDSILTDTADLQANQGNWTTATGFATSVELAVVSGNVDSILTDTADLQANQGNWLTATGFSTSVELAVVSGNVDSILTDTAELQTDWVDGGRLDTILDTAASAAADDAATIYTYFVSGSNEDAFKADVSALATSVELAVVSGNVDSILTDTADLQANQGNWLTATGFSTSVELAVVSGNVDSILTDTAELQTDWVDGGRLDTILDTAASAAADDAATIYTYFVSGSNEDAFKADVSALATSVELAVVSGNVDSILTDTADLQANQGNWLTATGFSTSAELTSIDSHLAVVSGNVDSILTDTADLQANQGNWTTATGFATSVELAVVSGNVDSILTDTADLQANQGNWLTATGFSTSVELAVVSGNVDSILTDTAELQTDWVDGGRLDTILDTAASAAADDAATIYTYFVSGSNEDAFKADVSALATSVELAVVSGNVDSILTDTADLQANQGNWLTATGFSTSVELAVVSGNVDSILTDTAELQTDWVDGGRLDTILDTAASAAADDAATIYTYFVSGSNEDAFKADVSALATSVELAVVSGNVDSILTDTADLQANQGNWLTATGFSTSVELAVVSGNVDSILTDTAELQTDWVDGGRLDTILDTAASAAADDAATIYTYFVSGSNEDAFKADVSALATSVELAVVSGNVDSILTDTADLQANQGNWLTATGFSTSAELTSIDSHLAVVSGNVDSILTDTADLQANQGNWTTATGFATSVELAVVSGNVDSILTDTADLQANQGNWLTATGFSTSVELAVVSGNVDSILTDTAELQTDWVDGGRLDTILDTVASAAADDAATIYTYFVSGSNEDAFKADVSALATSVELAAVSGTILASGEISNAVWDVAITGHSSITGSTAYTLANTSSNIGAGSIATTVTVDDGSNPLDGAAVWISTDLVGSNIIAGTLYTNALGQATFMLDAGTYYIWKQLSGYNFTNPETLTVS